MSFSTEDYRAKIAAMTNRELVDECGQRILASAVMNRFLNDGSDDARCDLLYAEARRRGNPALYSRGFNMACSCQGHSSMREAITLPIEHGEPVRAS